MELLVLGGTSFLGHEIATQALERGHQVTCLARGVTGTPPAGAAHVFADRDEPDAFAGLADRHFDAVVDVARQPGQVRRAVEALEPIADHYVLVSTGNVYAEHGLPAGDESAPLLEPLEEESFSDMADYGRAKVACEAHVRAGFGPERTTIARAGLLGGPDDPSGRGGYWPWRFAHPVGDEGRAGAVLVPDDPGLPCALLDVRDLASWLLDLAEGGVAGIFDAFGDVLSLAEFLEVAREAAGHTGPVVAVDPAWLLEHGVQAWMGPDSLPLWLDDPDWRGFGGRAAVAARAAGLRCRPLVETLRTGVGVRPESCGLSDEKEAELLRLRDLWEHGARD